MKKLLICSFLFFMAAKTFAQSGEFAIYPNGYIYSESTMDKLAHIVDSLNLKYKTCDLNQTFYAIPQTTGHFIQLNTGNIKAARKDLNDQISFEDFIKKYPRATIRKNTLITKSNGKNYEEEKFVYFREMRLTDKYECSIRKYDEATRLQKEFENTWIVDYSEKTSYSKKSIEAFYFPNNFESQILPQQYARMIGYADCLIDTTTLKFKEDAAYGGRVDLPKDWQTLSSNEQQAMLDTMRSTRVFGSCSMDIRPRVHAANIALLSAETTNWEVFLRAHLDIMNDRFDRMSDGSYAWKERGTYIGELEALDINVADLIFGISLRIENSAKYHYFGSIFRLGRALSETNNNSDIEQAMLDVIADDELDDFNRILMYYLFLNYSGYLKDESVQKAALEKLELAVQELPTYLYEQIQK